MSAIRALLRWALPLALLALGACSRSDARSSAAGPASHGSNAKASPPSPPLDAFAAPSDLTATLTGSFDVELRWKHNATEPGGAWVEFTTPDADFVKLDAVWPGTTTYRHAGVAPETTFIYRVVPFFGRASEVLAMTTGRAAQNDERPLVEGPLESESSVANTGGPKAQLRTRGDAAPARLSATLPSATIVDLRWEDRSADEDGYLVELAEAGRDFQIGALLPPNATSFRKSALPPATRIEFRVRAFFYGASSSPASVTTPAETSSR
jgi:hypothetical protein